MEYQEFINSIGKRLTYRGRAMAFYEDGRDYGCVTVMSTKTSHYLITSDACFIYSEANHKLIGTAETGLPINSGLFAVKNSPFGRKYILTCKNKYGQQLYIGEFF